MLYVLVLFLYGAIVEKINRNKGDEEKKVGLRYNLNSVAPIKYAKHDPRIIELVRFLARRAAESDYKALLTAMEKQTSGERSKED